MKIAVVGPQFPDSFANNVSTTLQFMGHEVMTHPGTFRRHDRGRYAAAFWEYSTRLVPSLSKRMFQQLARRLREFKPNLVLITHDFFSAATLAYLKSASQTPTVCWFIDAPAN